MFALGTYPLPPTIERFGRQRIMFWSALVCALFMTAFVALIGIPNPTVSTQWAAAAVICLWNMVFGYGWVGVPWLYGPEVCSSLLLTAPSTDCYRSRLSSTATSVVQPAHLANGSSASSQCLLEASRWRILVGRYGCGCSWLIGSLCLSYGSSALRRQGRVWKRLTCCLRSRMFARGFWRSKTLAVVKTRKKSVRGTDVRRSSR
jgi:hypothetical protein